MYGSGYGYYGFHWTYILVLIGMVICMVAQGKVKSTYARYAKVKSHSGVTAAQAALRILQGAGIGDVQIQHIPGNLTDNYNSQTKILSLSDSTYASTSVAAIGVAAHECGHAIQDNTDYVPLRVRGAIVPAVNIGSTISWPLILLGVFLGFNQTLITFGILLFSLTVLFQLVTLPVEFDASGRALQILGDSGLLYEEELAGAKKVLTAAALTYVAAAASSILQLLRLVIMFGGRRD
ncbi:MAG: zinc metallopeptidase [Eubacterium sp.]|nr:zinc metallopeptidase [Eubacterium sp.]